MVLHDPSGSVHLPWISNLPVTALHDPCADKINASAFLMPFLHAVPTCSAWAGQIYLVHIKQLKRGIWKLVWLSWCLVIMNLLKLICAGRLVDCCLISIDEKQRRGILMHDLLNIWKLVWLCWCLVIKILQQNPLLEHWWEWLIWVPMQIELGVPLQKKRFISPAS